MQLKLDIHKYDILHLGLTFMSLNITFALEGFQTPENNFIFGILRYQNVEDNTIFR